MMRKLWGVWAVAALLSGCPRSGVPENAVEELPPWMTKGEEVRTALVEELLATGNTLGALDILRQMRSEGFDAPALDLLQGKALRLDGVASEAERLLLVAQKKMPKDARPAAELCILYADLGRLTEAVERCERATHVDSKNASAWNNLGFLLLAAELPDRAILAAEKAIELDGGEPRFRNNLAMAQAALGREDLAFRTLQSTMNKADAAYMVGIVVERFNGLDHARPWYEKALQINPNHPEAKPRLEDGVGSSESSEATPEAP